MLQHEICPDTNFLEAKKTGCLGVAGKGTVGSSSGKVLASKN